MKLHKLTRIYYTKYNKQLLEQSEGVDNVFFLCILQKYSLKMAAGRIGTTQISNTSRSQSRICWKMSYEQLLDRFMFKHIGIRTRNVFFLCILQNTCRKRLQEGLEPHRLAKQNQNPQVSQSRIYWKMYYDQLLAQIYIRIRTRFIQLSISRHNRHMNLI